MKRFLGVSLFLLLASARATHALDITTCGQTVPAGEIGNMLNDLDCPLGASGVCAEDPSQSCVYSVAGCETTPSRVCVRVGAVVLENGARLLMDGHKIRGGDYAVECVGRTCGIAGGAGQGVLESAGALCSGGIWGSAGGAPSGVRMVLSDLHVAGGGCTIVRNSPGQIFATNLTIDNASWGIVARRLQGSNIVVNNSAGHGIHVPGLVKVDGLTANGNGGYGIIADKLRGSNIQANGNTQHGIAGDLRATTVEASSNGAGGIRSPRTSRLNGLTAVGNGGIGVETIQGGLRLENATVTGNVGSDLSTHRRPSFRGTVTCGTSNWGVCSLD
jgi:hypothetical protein